MKTKTITLECHRYPDPMSREGEYLAEYRVKSVTDSIEYTPGDVLTKKVVESLCDSGSWKVTLIRPSGSAP